MQRIDVFGRALVLSLNLPKNPQSHQSHILAVAAAYADTEAQKRLCIHITGIFRMTVELFKTYIARQPE